MLNISLLFLLLGIGWSDSLSIGTKGFSSWLLLYLHARYQVLGRRTHVGNIGKQIIIYSSYILSSLLLLFLFFY